jgi:nucleoside-specific outer membrane channel protein Tsx
MAINLNVFFLSEERFKSDSVINENVDPKIITPTIREVQNINILPLLGTTLYNELTTQIETATLTADNVTLLESYIIPTMVWFTKYEIIPYMAFKFENKNIAQKSSDNSTPSSVVDLKWLMDNALNKAQWYAERTTRYLCANPTLYPSYRLSDGQGDNIQPNKSNYNCGWVL